MKNISVTIVEILNSEYKDLPEALEINYGFHNTPFGWCLLAVNKHRICHLSFIDEEEMEANLSELKALWLGSIFRENIIDTSALVQDIFFSDARLNQMVNVTVLLKGTEFQLKVWRSLLSIPSGSVISYSALAALIGDVKATRVVASSVAKNKVSYLIPCHRVIASTGKIHNYRWGVARKEAILAFEGVKFGVNAKDKEVCAL